ncbi:MAG: hypothetical protein ACPGVU_06370 [Limisphaerales bacterium]
MISRKIGKIIRGNATPFQIFSACILGSMVAFLPGLTQAPGMLVILFFALAILNANLTMALLVGLIAKLAAIALTPASFSVGRFLLDGPTSGLFQSAINAPVLALCGLEYYTVTGGLFLGVIFGIVAGFVVVRMLTALRKKMAALEEGSEMFKKLSSSKSSRLLTWIFLGPDAKKGSWDDLLQKKMGMPIRPLGIAFVGVLAVLIFVVVQFGKGPILTAALQDGLEKANGATVDLKEAQIDFGEGKLSITGLAVADASNLDFDILRAVNLEADIGTASILSKRMKLDRVVISSADHEIKRATRAYRVRPLPEISEPPAAKDGDSKTIDDYLNDAKIWKERLAKVKEWLEKMSGPEDGEGEAEAPSPENKEAFEDWLNRQVATAGYNGVKADHLLSDNPTFTIGELVIEKLNSSQFPGETIDINAKNLTTHPWLVKEEKAIVIKSSKDTLGATITLGGGPSASATNTFNFHFRGVPTDKVAGSLKLGGEQALSGGTMDIVSQGSWRRAGGLIVNLPVQVQLKNVNLNIPGAGQQSVSSLDIPIGIEGPLDNPRIKVESKAFASAVKNAAIDKGKTMLQEKAGEQLNKVLGDKKIPGEAGDLLKKGLGGLLGGKKP